MKRILKTISFVLVFVMTFSFVSCAGVSDDEGTSDSASGSGSFVGSDTHTQLSMNVTTDKSTDKSTNNSTSANSTTTSKPYTIKGYILSASTPADTYGNGMFLVYKLSDGRLFVFDGGNASVKNFMVEALQEIAGTKKVKVAAWVMTHDHGDHYGALIEYYYANASTIGQVLDVEEFWMNPMNSEGENVQKHFKNAFPKAKMRKLTYGEEITLDKIKMTVLSTPDKIVGKSGVDVNSYSLVMMLNIGGKKILMTGDANEPTWNFMVDQQKNGAKYSLKCDYLQVPHHGVQAAGTTEGYNAADAKYLVIPSTIDLANKLTTSTNAGPSYNLYKKHGINIGKLSTETDNKTYWFAGSHGKSGTQDIKCFFTYTGTSK